MRWLVCALVMSGACGGGVGGSGGSDGGPMAACALSIQLSGDRTETFTASSCGLEAPGHFMDFNINDDGSTIIRTDIRLSTPSIAIGTQVGRLEYRENKSGDFQSWITETCSLDVQVSELLGVVMLADKPFSLFQVNGMAACPDAATMGTSTITFAPFAFMAGAIE